MSYQPEHIDTSKVQLSEHLEKLIERLAKNVHNVWAKQRLADGWRLGPVRDDEKKEHPCLVPYEQLPESERQYDRQTVTETIKTLIAMGYTINKPPDV
ncbi:MAG: RyR domain-containing protein [Planctomycetota bacterium]|nr:RyR domain-containing protein [Planctomycetota bacterium]